MTEEEKKRRARNRAEERKLIKKQLPFAVLRCDHSMIMLQAGDGDTIYLEVKTETGWAEYQFLLEFEDLLRFTDALCARIKFKLSKARKGLKSIGETIDLLDEVVAKSVARKR